MVALIFGTEVDVSERFINIAVGLFIRSVCRRT
jgi:hypothetical protein